LHGRSSQVDWRVAYDSAIVLGFGYNLLYYQHGKSDVFVYMDTIYENMDGTEPSKNLNDNIIITAGSQFPIL